ncbi:hypothetical protein ABPG74_000842 [Tetrahymena malaccensis]
MQFNQEGISQRGDQVIQDKPQNSQDDFNSQSFLKKKTIGEVSSSVQKRLAEREKNNLKGHLFLEPKWNNSFHLEDPTVGIVAIIALIVYFFCFQFGYLENNKEKLIFGGFAFFLYIMDCCTNGVAGYLQNKVTVKELQSYLNEIKQMKFELSFDVSSYHYESRRHYDSKSKRYVTSEVKITTYREKFNYPVGQSIDETEDSTVFFEKAKYFRIHNFITYSFGDEQSARYYDDMIKYAKDQSKIRDIKQTEEEIQNCVGLKTTLLACQDGVKQDPMLSMTVYIIYCAVGLSLLYRVLLNRRVCFLEHCIHKRVIMDINKVNPEVYQIELARQSIQNEQIIQNNQEIILKQQQQLLENDQNGILKQNQQPINYDNPQEPSVELPPNQ